MKIQAKKITTVLCVTALALIVQQANAAIALDRTRIIFDGSKDSMSVTITNQNKTLPYLAQSWIENAEGKKIESPMIALPPLQRVEAEAKGQVKIQTRSDTASLPQDRESLFYFNTREIPPKSSKPNTLQLALQTRVKMFYRPAALTLGQGAENEPAQKITLSRQGDSYQITNPTPYFITIVGASTTEKGNDVAGFKSVMVSPKSNISLGGGASSLGAKPVLTFINDFGGRPKMIFKCSGSTCSVESVKAG